MCNLLKVSFILLSVMLLAQSCNDQKPVHDFDRMAAKFKPITEIGVLKKLTDENRDLFPLFRTNETEIAFSRLLVPTTPDSAGSLEDAYQHYYSIDYLTNKIFLLEEKPEMYEQQMIPPDSIPSMETETILFGFRVDSTLYICAESLARPQFSNIYSLEDGILNQLTYGKYGSYLRAVSPDSRYLAFYYGEHYERLVVLDIANSAFYEVPKENAPPGSNDYQPAFSPDSKRLTFIRTGDKFKGGPYKFGDLWLIEFKD